jgi:hypothetical protein
MMKERRQVKSIISNIMKRKIELTVRLNSHVRPDQKLFIKNLAKKEKKSEGQINRAIIDFYMLKNK